LKLEVRTTKDTARWPRALGFGVATLAAVTVAAGTQSRAAQQAAGAQGVMLGILREDSVLEPFAVFDGRTWTGPWEKSSTGSVGYVARDAPKRLADIPRGWWGGREPATEWELLGGGAVRRRVKVTGVTVFENHCTGGVGLSTDHLSPVRIEPNSFPLPYAGIVATAPGLLQPVARIREGSATFDEIARTLPRLFTRLEPGVWETVRGGAFEPLLTGTLPPPSLDYVNAAVLPDGRELLTFTARRHLPRNIRGEPLEMVTGIAGWMSRRGTSTWELLDAKGSQTDLDGKGGDDLLMPRATLTLGGRTFWVGSTAAYEWETYFVLEVTGAKPMMLVLAEAGGC
jgi:hypothetical protein